MTTYSVADAKDSLPRLLDRALDGEEVIISRHGKAIAELRPITTGGRKGVGLTSVELLNQLYDDPEA